MLQSMGSQRVGHSLAAEQSTAAKGERYGEWEVIYGWEEGEEGSVVNRRHLVPEAHDDEDNNYNK